MAERIEQIIMPAWSGFVAAFFVVFLTIGTLTAVGFQADSWVVLNTYDWAAVRFTVLQALLSAVFSVLLAIPVARALARRRFLGRGVLITLLGAPFILPVIVAILGLLSIFGRNGVISGLLGALGLEPLQIFGLHGVVLAHVFFNLPLATRLILQGWTAIPAERFRLAASLGLETKHISRLLEWPMLKSVLPGAFMIIFTICTTSFAVALTLGGGPSATTVELAIYQAFRFDFDLGHAAQLALLQFMICSIAAATMLWLRLPDFSGAGLDRTQQRPDAHTRNDRLIDVFWIGAAATFLLAPLTMIMLRGFPGIVELPTQLYGAAGRSVLVALLSVCAMMALVLPLAFGVVAMGGRVVIAGLLEGVGYLAIAASPLVIGTGLFILIYPVADPIALALPLTALVNALMALPFALRVLVPAAVQVEAQYSRLADSLGLTGWARIRWLYLPRMRRPLGFSAGLAAALSMGDLGVIALFNNTEHATLPLQMYRLMAGYRLEQAAGAALLLLILSLALFWVFDRGGRIDADA